ncbi:hypothetical protein PoB_006599200 [Plakobranchus ocellatus]|uniref:Uncharacterized protein n=1 Tax=Plakobranchus ocellatus TaxID=259542 RepID=A0AAV4D5S2_9GAST|nr:hypothetical protein PoB_006599200 [Plakobranchus ocellatus]
MLIKVEDPPPSFCWQQRQPHELPLCKASLPRRVVGRDQRVFFIFFLSHEEFLGFSSRAPRPPRSPTKGTRCMALQRCVRATLELYSQQRVWDLYWD